MKNSIYPAILCMVFMLLIGNNVINQTNISATPPTVSCSSSSQIPSSSSSNAKSSSSQAISSSSTTEVVIETQNEAFWMIPSITAKAEEICQLSCSSSSKLSVSSVASSSLESSSMVSSSSQVVSTNSSVSTSASSLTNITFELNNHLDSILGTIRTKAEDNICNSSSSKPVVSGVLSYGAGAAIINMNSSLVPYSSSSSVQPSQALVQSTTENGDVKSQISIAKQADKSNENADGLGFGKLIRSGGEIIRTNIPLATVSILLIGYGIITAKNAITKQKENN